MSVFNIAIEKANEFGKLLYITIFGSHLYGTNTENSDKDYKGIFLPSIKSCLLNKQRESYTISTGSNIGKNSSEDCDIQFWSLQYWLKLLEKGDTNAIDLLASMYSTHNEKPICRGILDYYIEKPLSLIDLRHNKAYVSYAFHQAKKYGLKGSRIGILKEILNYLTTIYSNPFESTEFWKAGDVFDEILKKFHNPSLCFEKKDNNNRFLYICGKGYMDSIKLSEMIYRLNSEYEKYGDRARQAEQNENIDWKAVSHAIRCLDQVIEMAETGNIVQYPLKTAPYILEIKQGKHTWQEVESVIIYKLDIAEKLIAKVPENKKIKKVHEDIIINAYKFYEKYIDNETNKDRVHIF